MLTFTWYLAQFTPACELVTLTLNSIRLFTSHSCALTLFCDISSDCITWFGAEHPWRSWGDKALFTKTSPCLMTWCLGSLSLYLVASTLVHATSWFHILRLHILNCVLRGFTFERMPHMTLKGTKPSLPWDTLMLWSIMMMEWTKLIFTNLSSILTLRFVDRTVYVWLYLTTDLSHCTHWPLTLEEAVPFQGEPQIRSKGTTPFPFHGFWSSGFCTMHLDISWLLPLLTCHHLL